MTTTIIDCSKVKIIITLKLEADQGKHWQSPWNKRLALLLKACLRAYGFKCNDYKISEEI